MSHGETAGCRTASCRHDQFPGSKSKTPLEAINNGNLGMAVQMIEDLLERGAADEEDSERLAWAKLEIGDADGAARAYRELLRDGPASQFASHWLEMAVKAEKTARNGVAILRPNNFGSYLQSRDPDQIAAFNLQSPHSRVLIDEAWIEPGGYVPPIGLLRQARNWLSGKLTDLLEPIGAGVHVAGAFLNTPDKPGLWTRLPKFLALAVLAYDRHRLLQSQKVPSGVSRNPGYKVPGYAKTGPTPDGAFADPKFPLAGTVGTPNPIHGPVEHKADWSRNALLPDPARVAAAFGYRNGKMIEAPNLSAHVWAHLQQLVHDVLQTMPDDTKKYAMPSAKGSAEERLGINWVYYRADAHDQAYGDMNGITGAWDMSHIYGSSIAAIDKIRTNPATGELCPDGKLYLEGMDSAGPAGQWLPVEENDRGERRLVTGFNKNVTLPLLAEHTLYARHHNWVCDILASRHPNWHANQIFQIARRVVTMTYVKIHTGAWTDTTFAHPAVVEGLHANLYGRSERKKPFHSQKIFNPEGGNHPVVDGLAGNRKIANTVQIPEQKGKYFPIAYRFAHAIVNDDFDRASFSIGEPGKPAARSGERINLQDLRDLDAQAFLKTHGLGAVYHSLMNTTMGAPTINNYADIFNRMPSEEGVLDLFQAEIAKDRQRAVGSYQQFRADHYLPPIRSYRDLFAKPDSDAARDTIAKLEELYGGYNRATGAVDLDAMLGLLINENRPAGFAITNEGFQTFVLEASARIMKQPMLTTHWHPNDVGWTAINLVEAISKEKLIAMHTAENPRMLPYLKGRHKPVTFNDMSTDQRSPLEAFIDFSGEQLHDAGLGAPWREEHFTGRGLDDSYLTRIVHEPSGEHVIVDATEGLVYRDHAGDGRVRAGDAIAGGSIAGVSCHDFVVAAQELRDDRAGARSGMRSKTVPALVSGWRLGDSEVRRLKMWKGDPEGQGVVLRPSDLQRLKLIFDLAGSIDDSGSPGKASCWTAFEKGRAAPASAPKNSGGIFDQDGNADATRLGHFHDEVVRLAAATADGHIPRHAFMEMLHKQNAEGFVTRRQWDSLFRLLARIHGRPTITVAEFDGLFDGELLAKAFECLAPSQSPKRPIVFHRSGRDAASNAPDAGVPDAGSAVTTTTLPHDGPIPPRVAEPSMLGVAHQMSDETEAPTLPIGSFEATSPQLSGRKDRLVLQVERDPEHTQGYYATLSEYTRQIPAFLGRLVPSLQMTSWVPRIYPYYVTYLGNDIYQLHVLRVAEDGSLKTASDAAASRLKLGEGTNPMRGAVLTRLDKDDRAEEILFDGTESVSTWERDIVGNYFLAIDRSGGEYFEKGINATVTSDMMMRLDTDHLMGDYSIRNHAGGLLFTLVPVKSRQLGSSIAKTLIGKGIDIVNWKPFRTTIEILLINPDNPRDVKFFYERHDRDPTLSLRNLLLLLTRRLRDESPMTRERLQSGR